jgi:hypothetical protein
VGKSSSVSVVSWRSLNQALLHAGRTPTQARLEPRVYLRALRYVMHMSQDQLSRRSGVKQCHISRFETGKSDLTIGTLRRLFDAAFCDLIVMPKPRKRPGDAYAERRVERPDYLPAWD